MKTRPSRGVGLPCCLPSLAKFHYIEFLVTSYTRGDCPPKHFFSRNVCDGEQNFLWVLNLIYGAHMVGVWVCQIVFQYHVDLRLGGWPGVAYYTVGVVYIPYATPGCIYIPHKPYSSLAFILQCIMLSFTGVIMCWNERQEMNDDR